jgi:hypothetical protein
MLKRLWERWKSIAHKIGAFQSRVLLNFFYFLILAPFGLGVKLLSDPLRLKRQNRSHWLGREDKAAGGWEGARRQF